jgi:hypothetical protein
VEQTRYWIEFGEAEAARNEMPLPTLGVGVTAWTEEDALILIAAAFVRSVSDLPRPKRVIADVDVSTLDSGHIVPGVGDPARRGVWYPRMQPNH